jgi:hypothetical protein
MPGITRRDFLKYAGIGALGLIARPGLARALGKLPGSTDGSDVVQCSDVNATAGSSTINEAVVQTMVDESIKTLSGLPDVGEAWKTVFPDIASSSVIGIKVNCINSSFATHPPVVNCIVNGLALMDFSGTPFPKNNVIVWDRTDSELTSSGYTLYDGSDPARYRCFGTSHSGIGYDTGISFTVNGVTSRPSKILSQLCDYLIDAAVLRTHSQGVITLTMKNHYGSVNNPGSLQHNNGCSPAVPSLNQQIRDVITPNNIQRLFFIDGLFGLYSGGPGGVPNFNPKLIIMSRDQVACDAQGQNVINAERARHGLGALDAAQITTAAQPPYSLGTTEINLLEVIDPSVGVEENPGSARARALSVAPHPFRNRATVTFSLTRASNVRLDLLDQAGRIAAAVYRGRLARGRHSLPMSTDGVVPGAYFLRLAAGTGTQVRKITITN